MNISNMANAANTQVALTGKAKLTSTAAMPKTDSAGVLPKFDSAVQGTVSQQANTLTAQQVQQPSDDVSGKNPTPNLHEGQANIDDGDDKVIWATEIAWFNEC